MLANVSRPRSRQVRACPPTSVGMCGGWNKPRQAAATSPRGGLRRGRPYRQHWASMGPPVGRGGTGSTRCQSRGWRGQTSAGTELSGSADGSPKTPQPPQLQSGMLHPSPMLPHPPAASAASPAPTPAPPAAALPQVPTPNPQGLPPHPPKSSSSQHSRRRFEGDSASDRSSSASTRSLRRRSAAIRQVANRSRMASRPRHTPCCMTMAWIAREQLSPPCNVAAAQ